MNWSAIFDNTFREMFSINAIAFALAAIGLNVHFGYTGLLNFGQVGFMAIGAYGVAIPMGTYGWSPLPALLVGVAASVALALILGIPTLRLRADYLAIVTIATAEIIRLLARSVPLRGFAGGSSGINEFAEPFYRWNPFDPQTFYGFGPFRYLGNELWMMLAGWALVAVISVAVWLLIRSPWGRVVKSIREDEDAARSLGKNAYWYKLQALILGGVIGGVAGMVLGIARQTVQPDAYANAVTFFVWTALILGGVGKVWSPIVGSMLFWMLLGFTDTALREAVDAGVISRSLLDGVKIGQVRFILIGLGLAALMVFRPQGVFGNRNEMALDDR
ncbi:MAG: branched-chain amino acid ABC transporter permease [Acidimicrobiales bacterium]